MSAVEMSKAIAGGAKATTASEEGPRNAKKVIQRPPRRSEKAVALAAYCDLLGGASLPDDLVALATAADLDEARRALAEDVDGMITGKGWNRCAVAGRSEMLTRWELATPQRRAEEWGAPRLRSVIEARQRAEAEVARQARLAQGIDLEHDLASSTIVKLVKRGFVEAAADRDEPALLAAILRDLESGY